MLSVLFWILCPAGLIGLIVFPGKHKGALKSSDGARDIAISALLIAQMIFPLYGYALGSAGSHFLREKAFSTEWMKETWEGLISTLRLVNVNFNDPPYPVPGKSVYMAVMMTAVFCFFAGASIYENGFKIKHKIFLLIPLTVFAAAAVHSFYSRFSCRIRTHIFIRFLLICLEDGIVRYLFGAFFMTAILCGIYLLLKKLLKNEILALIVILVLSFFPPLIRIVSDGMNLQGPELRYLLLGPSIPLFPLGMLVMKYKDKILPKTKRGLLIHIALWIMIGGMSFYALSGLQKLLLAREGLHISDGYSCMPDEDFGRKTAMLEKIYKTECIPWLIFGLSLCMLLLIASRYCGSGNPVTRFCRENCYLITVLLFCRHIFYSVSGSRIITKVMPEHLLILVPFILFALSALLSYFINRVIRSGRKEKGT